MNALIKFKTLVLTALIVALFIVSQAALTRAQDAPVAKQRVLVLPFALFNTKPDMAWMSKSLQDNTVSQFGQSANYTPVAYSGDFPKIDAVIASRLARVAHAPLGLYGSATLVDQTIRLQAQLVDASNGDALATATSTGPVSDLLKLEDDLANQLRNTVVTPSPPVARAAAPAPAPAPAPMPAMTYTPTPYTPYTPLFPSLSLDDQTLYNTSYTPLYNPYYMYSPYPYFFSSAIYIPRGFHHHHIPFVPASTGFFVNGSFHNFQFGINTGTSLVLRSNSTLGGRTSIHSGMGHRH